VVVARWSKPRHIGTTPIEFPVNALKELAEMNIGSMDTLSMSVDVVKR
jgi:hypothetical protein